MLIVGSRTLERQDGTGILSACHSISLHSNILNPSANWNGFNVLHHEGSRVGALDVGISTYNTSDKPPKLVYILGADNIRTEDIPSDAFVIYQGSHGDEGSYFADLILPGCAYTEKNGTYVNTEGRVQQGRLVIPPPGLAQEDWKIIRALSEETGVVLNYDNIEEVTTSSFLLTLQLRYRIAELAPHLLKNDYTEPSLMGQIALQTLPKETEVEITPLNDTIDVRDNPTKLTSQNYYQTDAISRSSLIMAKCSAAFNPSKFSNFQARVNNP